MNEDLHGADVALRAVVPPLPVELAPVEAAKPLLAEEQLVYANLLDSAMKLGLLALTGTFLVYVSGVLSPLIPVRDLPRYWTMPVKELLAATGGHAGWAWIRMVHKGDVLNLLGIAFLAFVTILCYAAIIPVFFRKKERTYMWIAIVEVAVLALAASGILSAGAH